MAKPTRLLLAIGVSLLVIMRVHFSTAQNVEPADDRGAGTFADGPGADADADDVRGRIAANRALAGPYSEEIKLNAIAELERERQLHPELLAGAAPPLGVPAWQSLGPTQAKYQTNGVTLRVSDSGRIRTILPDPGDPDTLYLLTSGGGLWKTTTFTHTNPRWDAKTDSLISTSGGSVAFGRNSQTLYLGVGDPFDVFGLIAGVMVKSTDGGNTWSPFVDLAGATSVRDAKADTDGPSDVVLVATDFGMFRSSDDGATYTQVASGSGQPFFQKGVWSIVRTSAGWVAAAQQGQFSGPGSIYYSTDRGATWSAIPNAGGGFSNAGRATLAVASPGESTVYAFAGDVAGRFQGDLFRSGDGGLNWTPLNITAKTPSNPSPQAFYNQLILVDPLDLSRNTVYLGGQLATAKTTDGGDTWTLLSDWLPHDFPEDNLPYVHADCHAAAFARLRGQNTVFFGTDGGLFVSTDAGASWSDDKNDGIVAFLANSIVSSTKNAQDLVIGLQDTGSRARLGSSSVFNQVTGGDGEGVGWSQANNAVTITSIPGSGFFRSPGLLPNTFGRWRFGRSGISGPDFYPFFTDLATPSAEADPSGLRFIHATGRRVYKTDDGAATWHVIGQAGTNGLRNAGGGSLFRLAHHLLAISPADVNHVAVSELGGFVAITTDGGAGWIERNLIAAVPGYAGFGTSPAWASNAVLYVSSENQNQNPVTVRVVKSTDGGATWSAAQHGLPKLPINRIIVDPRTPNGDTVYAANWIGVYRTTDGGATWSRFGAGLPNVYVSDLYLSPDGSFLRVSTYGRGVWEIKP